MKISGLTFLFLDETQHKGKCGCPRKVQEKIVENNKNKENPNNSFSVKNSKEDTGSIFQMPLHYPKYTKKDYEDMPDWKLDQLLVEYGFSTDGKLANKRKFVMGAFLWPDFNAELNKSSPSHSLQDSSLPKKNMAKIVELERWSL